jgi:hypothetical protein
MAVASWPQLRFQHEKPLLHSREFSSQFLHFTRQLFVVRHIEVM